MPIIRFIGAFLVAAALTAGTSIVWPKLTGRERPDVLGQIYNAITKTEAGKQADDVLGEVTETVTDPNAVASASSSVVNNVTTAVQEKAQEVVTHKIVEEVIRRYEVLPVDEKEFMKDAICGTENQEEE